jgi:hypothetical protein
MVIVKCLYCDADNDARETAGYCDNCGKKLPPASAFRSPRKDYTEGTTDRPEELAPARRRTSEALFTAAVLWLIFGGLFLVLGPVFLSKVPSLFVPVVMLTTVLGLAWYALLGWWARKLPRPAALIALSAFLLGWLGHVIVDPSTALLTMVYTPVLGYLIRAILVSSKDRVT